MLDHPEDCAARMPAALGSFRSLPFHSSLTADAFVEVFLRLTAILQNEALLAHPSIVLVKFHAEI